MSIQESIRAARMYKGWSQEQLALEAGTSQNQVWRVESGSNTSLDTIEKIVSALGYSLVMMPTMESKLMSNAEAGLEERNNEMGKVQ